MAKKINLLNEHTFVFVTVIILGVIIISIYMIISPEKSTPFNFDPFPKIAPTSLPDPNRPTDKCWNKLTACTPGKDNECSACSLGEYECKTVDVNNHYHFNGINVPKGNWCLPKDKNPAGKVCNEYTGRYLWVFDPEYCNQVSPGNTQCWKCECIYPNLYGDPSSGCESKLACQNDSVMSNTITQDSNTLKATKCAPSSIQSCEWNPTKEQKNCDSTSLYQFTPYDQDKDGNPFFTCSCGSEKSQYFAQLPGDPLTCHLEPCYKSMKNNAQGLDNCESNCGVSSSCSCSCESTNVAKSPSGDYEGTCVLISNACGHYGYNKDTKTCECPPPFWPQECRSPNTGVNMDKPELPLCIGVENALGSQCVNPCEGGPDQPVCYHGAVCVSCGPNTYKSDPICNMDQWIPNTANSKEECDKLCEQYDCDQTIFEPNDKKCWIQLKNHNRTHAQCDCRTTTTKPKAPFSGFSGSECNVACLPDGHRVKSHLFWKNCSCYNCACCCSQRTKKVKDLWSLAYDVLCDGDYNPDQPAQSDCEPAEDCPSTTDPECHESLSC